MSNIERLYLILGEETFTEFEAEYYLNDKFNIEMEKFVNLLDCAFIVTGSFPWYRTKSGGDFWKWQYLKVQTEWSKYD